MKPEDRRNLELYAAGQLPAERIAAIERLVLDDDEARRFLAAMIGEGGSSSRRSPPTRPRSRHRSSGLRKHQARTLIAVSALVAGAAATAFLVYQYLPAPADRTVRTSVPPTAPSPRTAARPVFHPPGFSPDVQLYEVVNAEPRHPEVAVRAALYRGQAARKRGAIEEILVLAIANAPPSRARKLEPLVVLPSERSRKDDRLERPWQRHRGVTAKSPGVPGQVGNRSSDKAPGRLP